MTLGLDIRTIFAAHTLVVACLAGALSFTALTQKTYPGFKQWTLAAVAMAASYMLILARVAMPEAISITLGNACLAVTGALNLAGARRFLGLKPMPRYQTIVPVAAMAVLIWFYWGQNNFAMRTLAISLGMTALLLPTAWWLFKYAPRDQRLLYGGTAGVITMFCLLVLGRLADTLLVGADLRMFSSSLVQAGYFLLAIPIQALWLVGYLLINHGRLSDELRHSQAELTITADSLERILDFLPDPTWVIDQEGKVLFWNRAMVQLTGLKSEEVVGKGDYEYALPFYGQRRPALIDLVLRRNPRWEKEYLTVREEREDLMTSKSFHPHLGERGIYLSGTAARLYDEQGRAIGAIESMRDITGNELAQQEREALIEQLREALDNVKTLKGLIPICSHCKKIRRDEGYWEKVEAFITEHSEAEFSHGICPECQEKYYGYLDNDEETEPLPPSS